MKTFLQNKITIISPYKAVVCIAIFILPNALSSIAQIDSWQQKQSLGVLATARTGAVGFVIGDKGYVTTGYDSLGNYKQDCWEYDVLSQSWSQKASFTGGPRTAAIGFSFDGKGYVGTGHNGNNYYDDFWQYDPVTNRWIHKANFPCGLSSGA